ncbi:hypothetical protein [Paenibacillus sp. NPDC058071]|uniref:hypothetical protein n=1 Tax=Paenibacillus sp. NPDC058071 TaxID=3346326 RepID=UPI0036D82208
MSPATGFLLFISLVWLAVLLSLCKHSATFTDFPHKPQLCQNRNLPQFGAIQPEKRLHGIRMTSFPPFATYRPYFHPFSNFLALQTFNTDKAAKSCLPNGIFRKAPMFHNSFAIHGICKTDDGYFLLQHWNFLMIPAKAKSSR